MTEKSSNIHEAIIAIMAEVGYVQKESSQGLRYSYASEAALIQALRPAMLVHGVYAHVLHYEPMRDEYQTKSGTTMISTVVSGTVRFTHAPSDTHVDVMALGEGADVGDKSANKAMTGLLKYALRQTFLIETGNDPDKDSSDNIARESKNGNAPKPAARPLLPEKLREMLRRKAAKYHKDEAVASKDQRGLTMGAMEMCFIGDVDSEEKRKTLLKYFFDVVSGKDLTSPQVLALLDWLSPGKDDGGAYSVIGDAIDEANLAYREALKAEGQEDLF